ncbi:MAG: sigma-54-dependent Fis family transcriptional regulator, partial [Desulfobacteraceae bacterium]|nr:sigma-54-dependent Fis family transcriptional regulator [Desulfobacteraceae bacterium]
QLKERHQFHRIIGKSSSMQTVYTLLENLADTDSTALITGETGTGKELVAHAIHYNSTRKEKPFVKVNCSALAENLLESELFGHVKGAFTGAVKDKIGRFQMADTGTIFLDEFGDISPVIQLKLLRVLQEKEFERVGDSTSIKTDVRIIAATNANLKEKIKTGEFRQDLYYRIKVVDIPIPPLRERREDIPLLSGHFIKKFNKHFKNQIDGLSNEVIETFMSYSWPGNIRELEHAIEHGFVLCQGKTMLFKHLPMEIKEYLKYEKPVRLDNPSPDKEKIINALNKTGWNKSKAARQLGIGRRTIYRKIEEYKILQPKE